jgi:hypothetical protein
LITCSAAILARPAPWRADVVTGVIESLVVIAAVVPTVRKIAQPETASAASAHIHVVMGPQDLGCRTLLRGAVGLLVQRRGLRSDRLALLLRRWTPGHRLPRWPSHCPRSVPGRPGLIARRRSGLLIFMAAPLQQDRAASCVSR